MLKTFNELDQYPIDLVIVPKNRDFSRFFLTLSRRGRKTGAKNYFPSVLYCFLPLTFKNWKSINEHRTLQTEQHLKCNKVCLLGTSYFIGQMRIPEVILLIFLGLFFFKDKKESKNLFLKEDFAAHRSPIIGKFKASIKHCSPPISCPVQIHGDLNLPLGLVRCVSMFGVTWSGLRTNSILKTEQRTSNTLNRATSKSQLNVSNLFPSSN